MKPCFLSRRPPFWPELSELQLVLIRLTLQLLTHFRDSPHLIGKEQSLMVKLLGCSMVTVGQLVNSADLPQERKDPVKQVLLHLGVPASRTVGKAFRSLNEKHLTDHGLSIADAVAIFAESAPTTGAHTSTVPACSEYAHFDQVLTVQMPLVGYVLDCWSALSHSN